MNNKTKRPFLLTGLILALVSFSVLVVSGIISLAVVNDIFNTAGVSSTTMIVMLVAVVILAACGLVFSAICIPRWKFAPEVFAHKKGLLITTFVFCVLFFVFEIIGLVEAVNFVTILLIISLATAAVFIMLDICRNKKLMEKQNLGFGQPNGNYDTPDFDQQQFGGQQYNGYNQNQQNPYNNPYNNQYNGYGPNQYNNYGQNAQQNPYNNQYNGYNQNQQNPYNQYNNYGQNAQPNPYNNQYNGYNQNGQQYGQNPYNNQYNGYNQNPYNNMYQQNGQYTEPDNTQPNQQTIESFELPNNDDDNNDAQ